MAWKKQSWVKEWERRCFSCKDIKVLAAEFFYRKKSEVGWFSYQCKDCVKLKDKQRQNTDEYRKSNSESTKKYYRTHRGTEVTRNNWNIRRARKISTADWSVTHDLLESLFLNLA